MSKPWRPDSWKQGVLRQQARYRDPAALDAAIAELEKLPPLVSVNEIIDLRQRLADVAAGKAFILQGGDCAERFSECTADAISAKLKIMLHMSLVLVYGLNKPVVKVGRMAGQYAKPRSAETENKNGLSLPCYRGDLVNAPEFTPDAREPNPNRLLKGYSFASLTLNYVRTLVDNQIENLSRLENWDLDFISHSPRAEEYQGILQKVAQAFSLLEHLTPEQQLPYVRDRFFTCHEALHLNYEQALTRQDSAGRWYNLSTHLPWIGMRTNQLDSAHVEYMRGIANPVAVKVGPTMSESHLLALCDILDPDNTPGRLMLITRFGAEQVKQKLPPLISAIQGQGRNPVWCCDPMHGNTSVTQSGIKTRRFDAILQELDWAMRIHQDMGSYLGGVHFELTGDKVTECIGGARGLTEADLKHAYKSLVDPRLNADQALEMALRIIQIHQSRQAESNLSSAGSYKA